MKVNTSLCIGIANQREYDDTVIFIPRFTSYQASPRCIDRTLSGSRAYWHNAKPTCWAPQEPTRSEGSSMARSTGVALRGSRGVSTIPLTFKSPEHRTIFLACYNGDHYQAV
jgi:hypothetical protein